MIEKLLETIYDNTIPVIHKELKGSTFKYETNYKNYLRKKYSTLLREFVSEESQDTLQAIVKSYIDDEIRIWESLSENEMLAILDVDPAFEHLAFLSNVAFEQAKEVLKTKKYISNDSLYKERLKEIALCLNTVKPQNINATKELLSEAILDIDYLFGKSETMSLRLSKENLDICDQTKHNKE